MSGLGDVARDAGVQRRDGDAQRDPGGADAGLVDGFDVRGGPARSASSSGANVISELAPAAKALRARETRTGCSTDPATSFQAPDVGAAGSTSGSSVMFGSGPTVGRP